MRNGIAIDDRTVETHQRTTPALAGVGDQLSTMRDTCAIVGIGATPYYKRGQSLPQTELSMACTAILAALDDAGLTVEGPRRLRDLLELAATRPRWRRCSACPRCASRPRSPRAGAAAPGRSGWPRPPSHGGMAEGVRDA